MKDKARTNIEKAVKEMLGSPLTERTTNEQLHYCRSERRRFCSGSRSASEIEIPACMIEATLMTQRRLVHHTPCPKVKQV